MYRKKNRTLIRALGVGTASIAAAVVVAVPARAATISPVSGAIGATVRIADNSLANVAAPVVQLRTDACSATFTAPSATIINGLNVVKVADGLTFVVPTLPLGTNGAGRTYNACVYPGAVAGTSAVIAQASNTAFTVFAPGTSAPAGGPSGGGNTITVTAPSAVLTGVTAPGALFTTNPCPAVYTPAGNVVATATKVTTGSAANAAVTVPVPPGVLGTALNPTSYNACVYPGTTANDVLLTASTYTVALPPVTLSSSSGSYDTSNPITVSSGATGLFGGPNAPGVLFTSATNCPPIWNTTNNIPVAAGSVRRLAANRLALTVPPLPLNGAGQPQPYLMCAYTGASAESTVVTAAGYTSTILPNPVSITPDAGPAAGGIIITVNGTDFPTAPGSISASLGGTDLLAINPVSSSSFTATLPAHAVQEDATLVVTSSAGTRSLPGAFSFRDAAKVAPNSAPNTVPALDVSVQGAGFLNFPFGESPDAAKVYLVRGEYDGSEIAEGVRSNGPVAECRDVLVISDNELVCTMRLDRRLNATADGFVNPTNYTRTLTDDITTVAGSRVVVSASKGFTLDDVGHPIVQGGNGAIPAGTVIKSVLSPSRAVISAPAVTGENEFSVSIGGSVRTLSSVLIAPVGSTTVSLTTGLFSRADVGRIINSTALPAGTTITSVAPSGTSATVSAPAAPGTNATVSITATTAGSTTIAGTFTANDVGAVFGANALGIPPGTKIASQTGNAAVLTAAAGQTTAAAVTVPVQRPVNATLYPAAAVPQGAYNLTVVSNGAVDAVNTDPDYRQTAVTSSATFTVGSF